MLTSKGILFIPVELINPKKNKDSKIEREDI